MTQEEKAKRYDEAIERARQFSEKPYLEDSAGIVEYIFPELNESDDERIRKVLLDFLKNELKKHGNEEWDGGFHTTDVIAWLEKQGEQKPVFEMKTPEESLGIDSDTYNKIVDECIYGEQKPTDKVEPKFKVGDTITDPTDSTFTFHINAIKDGKYMESDKNWVLIKEADSDYELVEQKPTWSEEDEEQARQIERIVHNEGYSKKLQKQISDWLKSIKERVQTKQEWKQENIDDLTDFENAMMHIGDSFFGENAGLEPNNTNTIKEQANILLGLVPKQEWSEEDDKNLEKTILYVEKGGKLIFAKTDELVSWLKSLRPQNRWKPSDEQMNAIKDAIDYLGGDTKIVRKHLMSLYQDLKKLKEE